MCPKSVSEGLGGKDLIRIRVVWLASDPLVVETIKDVIRLTRQPNDPGIRRIRVEPEGLLGVVVRFTASMSRVRDILLFTVNVQNTLRSRGLLPDLRLTLEHGIRAERQ
ncbi:hypothetical protein QIS22_gp1 [ssRNA phage Gerhypos.3_15]|uniref:Uncharacterized protein n=1 Tax=ssRNA phage Gerhypos.3_15 TaxID=2786288 RepID=A0A8S5L2M1_9VIRU|nr:hypothetical protein QIS22_gp1 [ssRNA phage Gerhypos.3_15]DAD51613.1 TPA_asm: hypothetical protein [ssRNA phage Gerhypos.3_15]